MASLFYIQHNKADCSLRCVRLPSRLQSQPVAMPTSPLPSVANGLSASVSYLPSPVGMCASLANQRMLINILRTHSIIRCCLLLLCNNNNHLKRLEGYHVPAATVLSCWVTESLTPVNNVTMPGRHRRGREAE